MVSTRYMAAVTLLLSAVVWTAEAKDPQRDDPDVRLRASPRVSLASPGIPRPILLTVEIVGRETEKYYCPEIVWLWPDGTRSAEESDCAPYESRTDYPRRYNRRIAAYAFPRDYKVCVVLRKGGEVFDKDCARYAVR